MNISDPKQQIQDYLAGQMSPEEEKQFDSWLKQNPEGQKLFKQSAKDYQAIVMKLYAASAIRRWTRKRIDHSCAGKSSP